MAQKTLSRTDPRSLRDLVVIQRNLAPRNESGGFGEAWEPVCTVRANILPAPMSGPGGESMPGDWTVARNQYLITIYWRDGIAEQMRVVSGIRTFLINEAPQVGREDRFMQMVCEEIHT